MSAFQPLFKSVIFSGLLLATASSALAQDAVLYGVDGSSCTESTLYQVDPADGSIITTIGPTGVSGMTSMAFNPLTSVMYGITTAGGESDVPCESNLYTINLATGAATLVGPTGVPRGKPDAAFRADGTLFVFSTNDGYVYTVNLATGAMSPVGNTGVEPWDISLTFDGGTLVMTDGDTVYTVNTTTGLATEVAPLGLGVNDSNMSTTHPITGQVYLGNRTRDYPGEAGVFELFTLNAANGNMVFLGDNDIAQGMSAIEFAYGVKPMKSIPTLAGWGLLLLAGLLGLAGIAYQQNRARKTG